MMMNIVNTCTSTGIYCTCIYIYTHFAINVTGGKQYNYSVRYNTAAHVVNTIYMELTELYIHVFTIITCSIQQNLFLRTS